MEQVEAIRLRAEAATPGPWEYCGCGSNRAEPCTCGYVFGDARAAFIFKALDLDDEVDPVADDEHRNANISFVADARTDIPALVASHEALRAENVRLHKLVDAMDDLVAWYECETDRSDFDDESMPAALLELERAAEAAAEAAAAKETT